MLLLDPLNRPIDSPPAAGAMPAVSHLKNFRAIVKVVELRLRFVTLMAMSGVFFGKWDTIWNYYEKWQRPAAERTAAKDAAEYYCPMHPGILRTEPCGCPSCGMSLSRRPKGVATLLPEGVLSRVQLGPNQVSKAGIRTIEVTFAPLVATVTTVGEVACDEARLAVVASETKRPARVQEVHVGSSGVEVQAGQCLAELTNLDLDQSIRDLLLACRSAQAGPDEHVRLAIDALKLDGVRQSQIDEIRKRGGDDFRLPVLAPIGGYVLKKTVVAGQYVSEGAVLFEIADLDQVWVKAQVFEDQVGLVRVGQAVTATVRGFPGEVFAGRVSFVAPFVEPTARSAEVRYTLDNPRHRLRPGMSARVNLRELVADLPIGRAMVEPTRRSCDRARCMNVGGDEEAICPVTGFKLGSMGRPVAVDIEGQSVSVCCEACVPKLRAAPAQYLARLAVRPKGSVLSIPESAVIDCGSRTLVYVEVTAGVFEGRAVILGPRCGEAFAVLDGLAPGEKVAAAGAFLIDAESRINPATRGQGAY
jgi:membrane fusion protein, copper/silver efflux system